MRFATCLGMGLLLTACVSAPGRGPAPQPAPPVPQQTIPPTAPSLPPVAGFRTPQILRAPGLEGVIEQGANGLIRQFGAPRLDVAEGDMRKLQFAADACVMDVFLYPLRPGAEPVATYLETRRASDGAQVDRRACIAALRRSP